MKISSVISFPSLPEKLENFTEVKEYLTKLNAAIYDYVQDIYNEFNGKIDTSNLFCTIVTVSDTGSAGADFAVTHNLGHSAIYYIPNINSTPSGAIYLYKGATTWTVNIAYLKCNLANQSVTFLVFT